MATLEGDTVAKQNIQYQGPNAEQRFFVDTGGTMRPFPTFNMSAFGGPQVGPAIPAGYGNYGVPRVNLDPFRRAEIAAAERLTNLKFEGVRTELEGTIAQAELDRDRNVALLERELRGARRETRGDALQRGILDSGIFLENITEVETSAAEARSFEEASAANLIGGLRSQLQLLGAQRAAEIASQRAQIERAYLMARLSGL